MGIYKIPIVHFSFDSDTHDVSYEVWTLAVVMIIAGLIGNFIYCLQLRCCPQYPNKWQKKEYLQGKKEQKKARDQREESPLLQPIRVNSLIKKSMMKRSLVEASLRRMEEEMETDATEIANEEDATKKDEYRLTIEVKSNDAKKYSQAMIDGLNTIDGFSKKAELVAIESSGNDKAMIRMSIMHSGDLTEDNDVNKALDILKNDSNVKAVDIIKEWPFDEETETESAVEPMKYELTFNVKGAEPDASPTDAYCEVLIEDLMKIDGFKDKAGQADIEMIHNNKATVRMNINHHSDTNLMDEAGMKTALELLKNDKRVKRIRVEHGKNDSKDSYNFKRKSSTLNQTTALLICFNFKGTKEEADAVMDNLKTNVDNFEESMYENNITKIKDNRYKLTMAMYDDEQYETPIKSPVISQILEILKKDKRRRKLKVEKIPYYLW